MSRRSAPNPAAERAAANLITIKGLLKEENNKTCADCKRNKHPRWASWNLGVFVCIRCSGIHRGMGTHISRVKSVDLDAWTDEQMASIKKWGNSRANKYWEAKLAAAHVPSDSKIENFIRTKYESKRWVMDGPMPDPSTLDGEGDDDVPLNIVQERAKLERGLGSQRTSSSSNQPLGPPPKAAPQLDLFGDVPEPPARPNTTDTPGARAAPPKQSAPPKQQKAADSLLGLDFFGGPPAVPSARPASSSASPAGSAGPSRPDLKQSILSLYASAPKPQPSAQHDRQPSFGGMQSPPAQQGGGFGGLDDAFGNLNFSPPASQPASAPPKADPFAGFNKPSNQRSSAAPPKVTSPPLSGGGFFDASPKLVSMPSMASKPPQKPQANLAPSSSSDFGDFNFASSHPPASAKSAAPSASMDLFDFAEPSAPAPAPIQKAPAPPPVSAPKPSADFSAFNLSKPSPPQTTPKPATAAQSSTSNTLSTFSDSDAWGSNDAWGAPEPAAAPAPQPKPAAPSKQPSIPMSSDFSAWGGSPPSNNQTSSFGSGFGGGSQPIPKVAQDEDFGEWGSAAPETPQATNPPPKQTQTQSKPAAGGFGGGSDDLFSNVWG